MALTIKLRGLSSQSLLRNKGYLYNAVRCSTDYTPPPWNFLWEPGKYSKKDHNKIAEKYHLHPKDYKPQPEHKYMGDYPDLPMVGPAAKDPYYPYDIPVYKKNYHETLHSQFEIMTEVHYSFGYNYRIDPGVGSLIFLGIMAGFTILYILAEKCCVFEPLMEKQYPYRDKVHYTFEPAKE